MEGAATGDNYSTLDDILQFANVSGPIIALERRDVSPGEF